MQYKLIKPIFADVEPNMVLCVDNNSWVPFDPTNTDYQAYLKWLEEGNTPEPADQSAQA